jgi:hypothetical protein
MTGRFLEEFTVGQTFRSGRLRIDKERIKRSCCLSSRKHGQAYHALVSSG